MLNINASTQVFVACGATDLRKSIDGLSTIVQDEFEMNPFSEQLFVFCNQSRNRIKVLHWDHHAFWLYYRRLEQGTYKWPREQAEMSQINLKEFQWLLDGLSLVQYQEKHQKLSPQFV